MRRWATAATLGLALLLAACGEPQLASPLISASPAAGPTDDGSVRPSVSMTASPRPAPAPTSVPIDLDALQPGGVATVIATEPLVLRSRPGRGVDSLVLADQLMPDMRVGLLEGPIEADGGQWFRVVAGELSGWAPAASPDGHPWLAAVANGLIAFAQANGEHQVLVVAPDGSGVQQLALLRPDDPLLDPTVGVGPRLLPALTCGYGVYGLEWSPDGERLTFSVGACEQVVLTLGLDGVLERIGPGHLPRWSPDSDELLYARNVPYSPCGLGCLADGAGPWEIQSVAADGGSSTSITRNEGNFAASAPDWAPDGSRIAFAGPDELDGSDFPRSVIYVANADGSAQRRLAVGMLPQWSPDGRRLLYAVAGALQSSFETINADGTEVRPIGTGSFAAWSPDGTRIAIATAATGSGPPDTTRIVDASDPGAGAVELVGRFVGWSPDASQVLLIVPRPGGGLTLQRAPAGGGPGEAIVGTDSQGLTDATWQPIIVVPLSGG